MKIKCAINWLRKEKKKQREGHEPTDYITLAMQALEKQVPKKVIDRDFCPTCKQYLGCESFEQQHCDKCG